MFGFLDELPTWVVAILICGTAVVLTTVAQTTLHSRWSIDARRPLNEVTGFVIAVVGVIYAVLLASIAILAIERYDQAESITETEAGLLSDIDRNAVGLPDPYRTEIRRSLVEYIDTVINVEWPLMVVDVPDDRGWQDKGWADLDELLAIVARFEPQSGGQQAFIEELLDQVSALNDARRARIFLSENPIDGLIWWVVIVGGFSTVGLALLFGVQSAGHVVVSNILAFSIGLVLLLIFAMDKPFTGSSRVTVEPLAYVQARMSMGDGGG